MLIWVASYPRSGNTLTLLVLREVFGVGPIGADFEDDFSLGQIEHRALPGDSTDWRPPREIEGLVGAKLLDAVRDLPEPYFIKTHLVARAGDPAPALYLLRDGRDALVSHAHFVAENDIPRFRGMGYNRRLRELIHPGVRVQGGWSGNVRAWRSRDAPTAMIRFEHLIADPVAQVTNACAQLGVPLPSASGAVPDFARLHERSALLFRRGVVGAWRDEMPEPLERRFWRLHGQEMQALGYPR